MIPVCDLGALRAFAAVADASSFTRAAAALGVSASALSQTIRAFEDRTGTRLLNRTTRSVSLTEAGRILLDRARPALEELASALDQARASDGCTRGTVRVHAFHLAADMFLAPILSQFAREHPAILLDITIDDHVTDFVADGFDAAIRLGELIERDMVALRLGPDLRQVVVASPAYLAANGAPEVPRDLLGHRCIRWRWPGRSAPYAWEFCEEGRWFSIAVDGPLIANNRAFGIDAAADGIGIAIASEAAVAPHLATGRLVPLLARWSAPFPGFFLCYPQQRNMSLALRAFIDALRRKRMRHPGLQVPASEHVVDR